MYVGQYDETSGQPVLMRSAVFEQAVYDSFGLGIVAFIEVILRQKIGRLGTDFGTRVFCQFFPFGGGLCRVVEGKETFGPGGSCRADMLGESVASSSNFFETSITALLSPSSTAIRNMPRRVFCRLSLRWARRSSF